MNVTILCISHRHGNDISAYATETQARAALESYCRWYWRAFSKEPIPATGVVEAYIENAEGFEVISIDTITIQGTTT